MDADQPPPRTAACTHPPDLNTPHIKDGRDQHPLLRRQVNPRCAVKVWFECVCVTVCSLAAGHQLPQHQAHGVHVDPEEGVSLEVDGSF